MYIYKYSQTQSSNLDPVKHMTCQLARKWTFGLYEPRAWYSISCTCNISQHFLFLSKQSIHHFSVVLRSELEESCYFSHALNYMY